VVSIAIKDEAAATLFVSSLAINVCSIAVTNILEVQMNATSVVKNRNALCREVLFPLPHCPRKVTQVLREQSTAIL